MAQVKERAGEVWFSFHFSRGQNRKSLSKSSFCSETKRKRLLRRLALTIQTSVKFPDFVEAISSLALVQRSIGSSVILL